MNESHNMAFTQCQDNQLINPNLVTYSVELNYVITKSDKTDGNESIKYNETMKCNIAITSKYTVTTEINFNPWRRCYHFYRDHLNLWILEFHLR